MKREKKQQLIVPRLLVSLAAGASFLPLFDCATTTFPSSSAPVKVTWLGRSAEQPWLGLKEAIDAADQLLTEAYPENPSLRAYNVSVIGSNDRMITPTCVDSNTQRYNACTDTSLPYPGAAYFDTITVRQIRTSTSGSNPHVKIYSGALLSACESALLWDVAGRHVPITLGLPDGHDRPQWVQLRNRMQTRCRELLGKKAALVARCEWKAFDYKSRQLCSEGL